MLFLQELLVLSSGDLLLFWSGEDGEGGSGDRGSGDGGVGGRYECVATFSSGTNITMAIFEAELDSGKTALPPFFFHVSLPLLFILVSPFIYPLPSPFHIFTIRFLLPPLFALMWCCLIHYRERGTYHYSIPDKDRRLCSRDDMLLVCKGCDMVEGWRSP